MAYGTLWIMCCRDSRILYIPLKREFENLCCKGAESKWFRVYGSPVDFLVFPSSSSSPPPSLSPPPSISPPFPSSFSCSCSSSSSSFFPSPSLLLPPLLQCFKNIKIILILRAIQKQAIGHRLLTFTLNRVRFSSDSSTTGRSFWTYGVWFCHLLNQVYFSFVLSSREKPLVLECSLYFQHLSGVSMKAPIFTKPC